MLERNVKDWDEFEDSLNEIKSIAKTLGKGDDKSGRDGYVSNILYRGQSNSAWHLETTLERFIARETMSLSDYHGAILSITPTIETFTERTWNLRESAEYRESLNRIRCSITTPNEFLTSSELEYMAYLRHHNFPSPLLDWTQSPYVASHFAFSSINAGTNAVAIFAFIEYAGEGKSFEGTAPSICGIGHNFRTHARHHLQQSEYTVCTKNGGNDFVYCSHEGAFSNPVSPRQDLLWKFIIPVSERIEVLRKLEAYNINAYSLFGSEESLMSTMAIRSFLL